MKCFKRGVKVGLEGGASTDLSAGAVFAGRYRVERCVAEGGMGAVYEVVHIETNRRRALKVMHAHYVSNDELQMRFRQEARVAAEIESDHIVDVFDAGIDDATGQPFLVMELLRGEELGQLSKRVGALPKEDVVRYLYETSLALDKTHRARIVHRDLKPDNLFLCERAHGPAVVKVLDFGIAKIVKDAEAQASATRSLGTPLYMAPEQFLMQGAVSAATDIYALGMIAFTLLVGKPYWHQESKMAREVLAFAMHAATGPKEAPVQRAWVQFGVELPAAFDPWFFQATAREPGARFATAIEAVLALAEALGLSSPAPGYVARNMRVAGSHPILTPYVDPPRAPLPSASNLTAPTGPTMMAMTPGAEGNASTVTAFGRGTLPLVAIGLAATLVVGLGILFVVQGFSAGSVDEPIRPASIAVLPSMAFSGVGAEPPTRSTIARPMISAASTTNSVGPDPVVAETRANASTNLPVVIASSSPPAATTSKSPVKKKGSAVDWTAD